ncbi:PIG-L family deacetylase [Marinivivus vitaminiproducens]|nr:PIG-L family deacetylase [Geminicoccaceae bacterium SCSIO 64248]
MSFAAPGEPLRILCLGAHADDIEIGCGATVLGLIAKGVRLEVDWCVLSGSGARRDEAERSAAAFLQGAADVRIEVAGFRDGHFPYDGAAIKAWFERFKDRPTPDVIFTHTRDDRHQDHREVCQLTWNTFRDHQVLEYEIPKYDGDLITPNLYVPAPAELVERKCDLLREHFVSQSDKRWFEAETFMGLARLRGVECQTPARYAEAFHARKLLVA